MQVQHEHAMQEAASRARVERTMADLQACVPSEDAEEGQLAGLGDSSSISSCMLPLPILTSARLASGSRSVGRAAIEYE